ncbi:DNA-binding transcriptional regulator, MarR family [Alteribacillus persepolensis]|uniref:DNA-binding transcriptional regulator, MarR family n=1 Tax=Alteribacillus persepolensis TaxID=568899 RepID=A0A1G8GU82_9BACI|nr:MarR family transcriptional regulator [Alteribacillus persepolensis]SDH97831.1 DNA-binding transcriptional regulator, MarR family [Alteribacillus persepolensis]
MKPHQQFFYQYRKMYRPFIKKLNIYLSRHNLYSSQWAILHLLLNEGPHTIGDIAEYQNVEKPTVTRMIQRLKELDYIETTPGKDKREKKIQLTKAGESVCEDVLLTIEEFQKEALQGISEDEQLIASRILMKVRENLLQ